MKHVRNSGRTNRCCRDCRAKQNVKLKDGRLMVMSYVFYSGQGRGQEVRRSGDLWLFLSSLSQLVIIAPGGVSGTAASLQMLELVNSDNRLFSDFQQRCCCCCCFHAPFSNPQLLSFCSSRSLPLRCLRRFHTSGLVSRKQQQQKATS